MMNQLRNFQGTRFLHAALVALFLVAVAPFAGAAEEDANGPTSVVIVYKAKPETRAAFRKYLEKQGAAQFAQWQKEGVYSKARLLFTPFVAASTFDLIVVLDFAHYTDLARWKEIEKTMPGGLPAEALALGTPDNSSLAELFVHGGAVSPDPAKATNMVSFYQILTDGARYKKYIEGYTVPQMKAWIEAGVLSNYTMYLNQGVNTTWDALLVMEYKDIKALSQRDTVKGDARKKLAATDPVWKEWSTDKSGIRKEISLNNADPIVLPAKP